MIFDTLTEEQRQFALHPNEAFVQACPGAGKTRTILARIKNISTTLPPRKGIAVISFTNSAIEEFSERSSKEGLDYLLQHPGFTGTFDAFLRQFIFLPIGLPGCDIKPHTIDSWKTLGIEIRLSGTNAFSVGAGLDIFDTENCEPNFVMLSSSKHTALRNHISQHQDSYVRAARTRRANLNRNGYISAKQVRLISLNRMRDTVIGNSIGRALSSRFQEIIIDEAQDCDPLDLEVLNWLRGHGIKVTFVCDVDQSIYGFRDGFQTDLQAALQEYGNGYITENRLTLVGNFRSSPAICSLAASLRLNSTPDVSLGKYRDISYPVIIFPYNDMDSSIGEWFGGHIDSLGIPRSETMILAHSESAGRAASGNAPKPSKGEAKVEVLARAVSNFWTCGASKQLKNNSVVAIEKLLINLTNKRLDDEPYLQTIKRLDINSRILRRQAFELITKLPKNCNDTDVERGSWVEHARTIITSFNLNFEPRHTVRNSLVSPRNGQWSGYLQKQLEISDLPYSTIHYAKGKEYSAVCIVIPKDYPRTIGQTSNLMNTWKNRVSDESKRVVYVGATRSQQVVVIAIPSDLTDTIGLILSTANVSHSIAS